jgi:hypothetical protein
LLKLLLDPAVEALQQLRELEHRVARRQDRAGDLLVLLLAQFVRVHPLERLLHLLGLGRRELFDLLEGLGEALEQFLVLGDVAAVLALDLAEPHVQLGRLGDRVDHLHVDLAGAVAAVLVEDVDHAVVGVFALAPLVLLESRVEADQRDVVGQVAQDGDRLRLETVGVVAGHVGAGAEAKGVLADLQVPRVGQVDHDDRQQDDDHAGHQHVGPVLHPPLGLPLGLAALGAPGALGVGLAGVRFGFVHVFFAHGTIALFVFVRG